VFHVGHLFENRNLRALAPLASEPGLTVLMLASHYRREPESTLLSKDLEASGMRLLFGHRPDIDEIYRLADCYVFPTVQPDGAVATPLSVVEAKASGLPVVARRFRALGERVGKELQVDLVDSDDQLRRLVLSLRQGQATPSGAGVSLPDAYSWQGVARRLLRLIDGPNPATTGSMPADRTWSTH
jgi:glycosyltransferase involved in cell wall biosynthesis